MPSARAMGIGFTASCADHDHSVYFLHSAIISSAVITSITVVAMGCPLSGVLRGVSQNICATQHAQKSKMSEPLRQVVGVALHVLSVAGFADEFVAFKDHVTTRENVRG